jgi:phospholipid/cholesterol/gamma-HCH transport system substrate-binding protein
VANDNFRVGVFVAVALALFVGITLWLTGTRGGEPTTGYSMFFEKDVSGLMLGGPVYYLGVEVGTVTEMEIIPGDPMSVRVDIEVLESTPIDTGTYASLAYQGITGVAVINLVGDPGMNLPLKKPPGYEYPVVEVRDTGLAALLSDAPGIIEKVNALLERAGAIFGEENRALLADTLRNVETLSGTLSAEREAFAALPESLNRTLAEIRDSLRDVQQAVGDMRPGLGATVENLESLSGSLGSLAERLDAWAAANSSDMQDFMAGGLGQVPALVSDARDTVRELEKLLRALRENPSQLIHRPIDDAVEVDE